MAKPFKLKSGFRESKTGVKVSLQRRGPRKMAASLEIDSEEMELGASFNWRADPAMIDAMYEEGQALLEDIGEDHQVTMDEAKTFLTVFLRGFADGVDAVDKALEEE